MLEVGKPFPNFSLADQDGRSRSLADFRDQWLIVWVYPKDDTPGCTLEGKGFTAAKPQFDAVRAVAVGLSQDDVASHKSFCDKFAFTVPLLADPKAQLLGALGVGQSEFKGQKYWDRTTFVVDPQGVLRKVYTQVKPDGHERQVLEDVKQLQQAAKR